jgi:hypothetical protein
MLLGWSAISPLAQSPIESPAPLAKSIIGSWRGDAVYANPRTNFGRADLEMRFTDYGIVTVRRGPLPGRPVVDTWTGDYLILGSAVLISPHLPGQSGLSVRILSVAVQDNRLEGAPFGPGVSDYALGDGIQLRRQ